MELVILKLSDLLKYSYQIILLFLSSSQNYADIETIEGPLVINFRKLDRIFRLGVMRRLKTNSSLQENYRKIIFSTNVFRRNRLFLQFVII